ncbi:MAG: pentapeptide repeat-containing protein, partial [Pseudomonadota bacterium]
MGRRNFPRRRISRGRSRQDPIARINALTANARATWFALISALLFVGITLMGVAHIDFYGIDRATQLPLINVSVPTRVFFIAAPILIAAAYGYFHLYLVRLWDALGDAPARVNGVPLGDAIAPWLVSDAALKLRRFRREDGSASPRTMDWAATLLNLAIAWGLGPLVLSFLWWESMTARSPWMTGLGCLALLVSLWAGLASWVVMRRRMLGLRRTDAVTPGQKALLLCLAIPVILLISLATIERTAPQVNLGSRTNLFGDLFDLAPIVLAGDALVERPDDWLPYDIHRDVFAASWCRREAPACRSSHGEDYTSAAPQPETLGPKNDTAAPAAGFPEALEQEWRLRRLSEIARLAKPRFNPITPELWDTSGDDAISLFRRPPDLREANLRDVHMPGINLIRADLGEATLLGAEMERAT